MKFLMHIKTYRYIKKTIKLLTAIFVILFIMLFLDSKYEFAKVFDPLYILGYVGSQVGISIDKTPLLAEIEIDKLVDNVII